MTNVPADILKVLKNSGNSVLEANSRDMEDWSKLKHTKKHLEYFLNRNIAELKFKTLKGEDRDCLYTSNTTFIKLFSIAAGQRDKVVKEKSEGIATREMTSVMSWNLIDRKLNTIPLRSWEIVNWIGINEKNILILHEFVNRLLEGKPIIRG